jgi:hypothetical protein
MDLKPGSRWKSAVCDTEAVIVRPPKSAVTLECGGHPMQPHGSGAPAGATLSPDFSAGSLAGKRYSDADTGIEVLCTKPGAGSFSLDGRAIGEKEAKKLPASD